MNDDTLIEFENRQYIAPAKSRDESLAFIDTLRDVQAQNTAEINQNTYNLGSPVASNVGSLGGSEALWEAQYQTPQVDAQVASLKAAAQQSALNTALSNLEDIWANRYQQARRRYAHRSRTPSTKSPEGDVGIDSDAIDVTVNDYGTSIPGYAFVAAPNGTGRWYKIRDDGSLDMSQFIEKQTGAIGNLQIGQAALEQVTDIWNQRK